MNRAIIRTAFVLFLSILGLATIQAQTFTPAFKSDSLPAPAIHSRDEIIQRLSDLNGVTPGDTYAAAPSVKQPYFAGRLQNQFISYGLAMLNMFRYLAGLSDKVVDDPAWDESAQYGSALLAIINKGLDHTPANPPNLRIPTAFYEKGYGGTSTSDLDQGNSDFGGSVKSYMDDSDPSNIDRLGHRRWLLNPTMDRVGFGMANEYNACKVFSADGSSEGPDCAYVAWPGAGNQPLGWFGANQAWCFSVNPAAFDGGVKGNKSTITVRLQRQRDKKSWNFGASASNGYFNVETSGFGLPFCVIFRPDGVGTLLDGDQFTVTISGIKDGQGKKIAINYSTQFFNIGPTIKSVVASKKPSKRVIYAASQSEGMNTEKARVSGMQVTMGYVGPALTSFYWYVDSPDGILPIGIEINEDGTIHSPGEVIKAPDGGITSVRLISTESGLTYAGYANSKWTNWANSGDVIGFGADVPLETISISLNN